MRQVRYEAARGLRYAGWTPPDLLSLVYQSIADGSFSECVRAGAVATVPLIAMLSDDCPEVRKKSSETLAQVGDARAVEALIMALKNGDDSVRAAAASALARFGDDRAVEPLLALVRESSGIASARAAESLLSLMRSGSIARVSVAILDSIAGLENVGYFITTAETFHESDRDGCRTWTTDVEVRKAQTYDLSGLRQLARQEVVRPKPQEAPCRQPYRQVQTPKRSS